MNVMLIIVLVIKLACFTVPQGVAIFEFQNATMPLLNFLIIQK
jgi:hypothetical protein